MKFTIITLLVFVIGSITLSAASFPVKRTAAASTEVTQATPEAQVSQDETVTVAFNAVKGKSQLIALLLAGFVGTLGVHRFYLGYTWQGVVQLLTLGACGIWSLIDLIRIITGDLTPKNGRYTKTL